MNLKGKRILITGIPGSGKTTVGNHLRDRYGFFHLDMESDEDQDYLKINKILANPALFIKKVIAAKPLDIVMTWGFVPSDKHIKIVNMLKNKYAFQLIWFDGDRDAARRAFIKRSTLKGKVYLQQAIEELNLQMAKIDGSSVITKIDSQEINTFDEKHEFRNCDEIIHEIAPTIK